VREMVVPALVRHGPIEAWIIDDTAFPEGAPLGRGGRQYCGEVGKQENCQVAVSLSMANHHASLPVAYRCICRKTGPRRANGGVRRVCRRHPFSRPTGDRARAASLACEASLPRGVVLMDPAMGMTPSGG